MSQKEEVARDEKRPFGECAPQASTSGVNRTVTIANVSGLYTILTSRRSHGSHQEAFAPPPSALRTRHQDPLVPQHTLQHVDILANCHIAGLQLLDLLDRVHHRGVIAATEFTANFRQ